MGWVTRTLASSIGRKWLMALTGAVLVLFVLGHMLGNLQVFLGPDALNDYAVALHAMPALLWVVRTGLLVVVLLHIVVGALLWAQNRTARPVGYATKKPVASTFASRNMLLGGLFLFAFVLYHLAHLTLGYTNPEQFDLLDAQGRPDVFTMVVLGYREPLISGLYVIAMVPLALHLSHGVSSLFQSLGVSHPKYDGLLRGLGPFVGTVVFVANIAMPIAVLAGLVTLPGGGR